MRDFNQVAHSVVWKQSCDTLYKQIIQQNPKHEYAKFTFQTNEPFYNKSIHSYLCTQLTLHPASWASDMIPHGTIFKTLFKAILTKSVETWKNLRFLERLIANFAFNCAHPKCRRRGQRSIRIPTPTPTTVTRWSSNGS